MKTLLVLLCGLLAYLALVAIPQHGREVRALAEQIRRFNEIVGPTAENFREGFGE